MIEVFTEIENVEHDEDDGSEEKEDLKKGDHDSCFTVLKLTFLVDFLPAFAEKQAGEHDQYGCGTESLYHEVHTVLSRSDQHLFYAFKAIGGFNIFPEDAVDRFRHGDIGPHRFIDIMDALGGVKTFRDHVEFQLCGLNGITLADHISECAVTAVE